MRRGPVSLTFPVGRLILPESNVEKLGHFLEPRPPRKQSAPPPQPMGVPLENVPLPQQPDAATPAFQFLAALQAPQQVGPQLPDGRVAVEAPRDAGAPDFQQHLTAWE